MVVEFERVDRLGEFHPEALGRVEFSGLTNEHLREIGVHAPVARLVRIGQRRAPNWGAKTHMIELGGLRRQTGLDVPQALPIRQLGKCHNPEMLGATQRLDIAVATVPFDDPGKRRPRQKIHQLGEQGLARVHRPLREF